MNKKLVNKKNIPDLFDLDMLLTLKSKKQFGTIELSEEYGIAPKNIITRLKKLEKLGLLTKSKISLKPKGWKRIYLLTPKAKSYLEVCQKLFNFPEVL